MYAPLHTVIWGDPGGPAHFTFDKPSDQFGSFADPQIIAVGLEVDRELAALLEHLGVAALAKITHNVAGGRLLPLLCTGCIAQRLPVIRGVSQRLDGRRR